MERQITNAEVILDLRFIIIVYLKQLSYCQDRLHSKVYLLFVNKPITTTAK